MKKSFLFFTAFLLIIGHTAVFAAPPASGETPASAETSASGETSASEEDSPLSFSLDIETGAAFTGYNDVEIPADGGTKFSLADDLSADPVWFYRLRAGADYRNHSVSLLYAPLTVESTGNYDKAIEFNGETFAAGTDLTGTFKFNSYRFTYAYRFVNNPSFVFAAGLTGKVRDAYISLENDNDPDNEAKRENLGVVPLIHLSARWNFAPPFSLLLEGDGLAVPQGRAEDFLLALLYSLDEKTDLRIGYR
ncbi:MAG: hypothetical protein R6V67_05665, partial [Spirochaetia bacterium]